ncbi:MAG: hypothetical protein WA919_10380 [Coleofasciculaceae cyanobacterium]
MKGEQTNQHLNSCPDASLWLDLPDEAAVACSGGQVSYTLDEFVSDINAGLVEEGVENPNVRELLSTEGNQNLDSIFDNWMGYIDYINNLDSLV